MNSAKKEFKENICSINNSIQVYKYLKNNAKNMDSTILLRSQFMLIVSAFDTYVHSSITNKIIEIYFSQDSDIFVDMDISLSRAYKMKNSDENMQRELLENYLVKKLSKDSFQSPKSIEYAYSILKIDHIWSKLSEQMGMRSEDIRNKLALIVDRRNKIAHESDWNKITRKYEDIELETVLECQDFIENIVEALDKLANAGAI